MGKSVEKVLFLSLLIIFIIFSTSPALAAVSALIAKDSNGELYQFDYKLLLNSYALSLLDSPDGLYSSFVEKEAYAFLTENGRYISYRGVLDNYALAIVSNGNFDLEKYLLNKEAELAAMPGNIKKVSINSGNIVYTPINLEEGAAGKPDNPDTGVKKPINEPGENHNTGNTSKTYVMVDVNILNLRSGPGTNHEIIDQLSFGAILEVTDEQKEWLKVITMDSKSGWVHGDFVKKADLKSKDALRGKVIVVDPGHGGVDPGAIGFSGLQEKVVTLAVGQNLESLLQGAGASVIMTRTGDQSVSNTKRVEIANKARADLFVSIHANAFTSPDANGTETYYYENNENSAASKFLAQAIQGEFLSTLGLRDRGVKEKNFFVLTNSEMPAVLVEMAFLTNQKEEELLRDAKTQKILAEALFRGIESYFLSYR